MNAIVKHRMPHTPGPWHTKWANNTVYLQAKGKKKDISVCRVMNQKTQNNLNILLAAPDMLAALEKISLARFSNLTGQQYTDNLNAAIDESVAVICNAKGC
ncbi:hypothetical protein UFOVP231_79 [uncultured Caudovirales phage]|uniref:Uncharacterized protein n=1 Tax=uncultured Caudovirales phage TaxID=2100421 RepID=A0A6J7WQX8_9CAUD|nr:hypothetical protein UFOVP231_79 [uncultured Caudovirales phage]